MNAITDNLDVFWGGFLKTLLLVALCTVMATVAGVVLASMAISPIPLLQRVSALYVNVMRNIPAAAHLFFTIFILPLLGVRLGFFALAVIGITIYFSAYYCDAVRSGINAIGKGQLEAARAIGLRKRQTLRLVVLPQGLRNSVPPLINTTIALVKATAIAGVFGVTELFGAMLQLINTHDSAVIALMLFTGLLYSLITIPAGLAAAAVERKVAFTS
jgi:glutamate transport system permease protein